MALSCFREDFGTLEALWSSAPHAHRARQKTAVVDLHEGDGREFLLPLPQTAGEGGLRCGAGCARKFYSKQSKERGDHVFKNMFVGQTISAQSTCCEHYEARGRVKAQRDVQKTVQKSDKRRCVENF